MVFRQVHGGLLPTSCARRVVVRFARFQLLRSDQMLVCEVASAQPHRRFPSVSQLRRGIPPLEGEQVQIHRVPATFHDTDQSVPCSACDSVDKALGTGLSLVCGRARACDQQPEGAADGEVVRRGGVPLHPPPHERKKGRQSQGEGGEANPTPQLHETPLHGTSPRRTAQNFALFPHSLEISIFFLSGGLLVELSPRFKAVDHLMCTFGTPEKPKRALWVGHGLAPLPFHEKSPSEREERTTFATEWGKNAIFWAPLGPPPSHPPTLQAPLFQGLGPRPSFFIFLIFHCLLHFPFFLFIVIGLCCVRS